MRTLYRCTWLALVMIDRFQCNNNDRQQTSGRFFEPNSPSPRAISDFSARLSPMTYTRINIYTSSKLNNWTTPASSIYIYIYIGRCVRIMLGFNRVSYNQCHCHDGLGVSPPNRWMVLYLQQWYKTLYLASIAVVRTKRLSYCHGMMRQNSCMALFNFIPR